MKQGFHHHPKTVLLRSRGGSAAVEALQQVWLFAENARAWEFPNWTPEFVAAVGSLYGKPDFAGLLVDTGFLDALPGGGFALHDFEAHNAALIQRWANGRFGKLGSEFGQRGGRPRNPRETPGGGSGKPPVGGPKNPPTRPDQTSKEIPVPAKPPAPVELFAQPRSSAEPQRPPSRQPDPLFEALAELDGGAAQLSPSARTRVAVKLRGIVKASAEVTAEEIRRRAERLRRLFPTARVTAASLEAHWAECAADPPPRPPGHEAVRELEAVNRQLRGMGSPSLRELEDPAWQVRKQDLECRRLELQAQLPG